MRTLLLLAVLSVVILLASSSPIELQHRSLDGGKERGVQRRSAPIKGGQPGVKGYNPSPPLYVRKGEYICGNRVCKLKPGEIPKGCNGICQYPLK